MTAITTTARSPLEPRHPSSPRTPLIGRSISSQFHSPSSFRTDQDDHIIYELGARHLSAGFSGESRPRCILDFNPESSRRVGDYRAIDVGYRRKRRKVSEWELYRVDLRAVDLGLVEDRLERAVAKIHAEFLQLDQKVRKAMLVVPSLLPTPLVEVAVKVLFRQSMQMPSVVLLTTPLLACVGAGLRNALVVDVGWEESVVTAVAEYREVLQRRSVRAGKLVTREMGKLLQTERRAQRATNEGDGGLDSEEVDFELTEEVSQRMAWCRTTTSSLDSKELGGTVAIPMSSSNTETLKLRFTHLSDPAETALFTPPDKTGDDDHNLPLHVLAYRALLALPLDVRALSVSRIIITGGISNLPGIKQRLLEELTCLIETRGWDPVHRYGSAAAHHNRVLQERSADILRRKQQPELEVPLSPAKKPIQDSVPHADRIHDDKYDDITRRVELAAGKGKGEGEGEIVKNVVRGVETLGAWAGASLMASLRVKGMHEIEREEFLKHGLRDGGIVF